VLFRLIRILADVSFKTSDGWTTPMEAIIDTGGPISIIPRSVWEQIRRGFYSNIETEIRVGGQTSMGRLG
jgi:hypothetical protein